MAAQASFIHGVRPFRWQEKPCQNGFPLGKCTIGGKRFTQVVVSQNGEPQYRPPNTIVFITGTPKPLLLRNPQLRTGVEFWEVQRWPSKQLKKHGQQLPEKGYQLCMQRQVHV